MVTKLMGETGLSKAECKKALVNSKGDYDDALAVLAGK